MDDNWLSELNNQTSAIVEKAHESLVKISNGGRSGSGAGVVWSSEGLIITNAHVLHHETVGVETPEGEQSEGQVIGYDPQLDLGLVKIGGDNLTPVELRDSDTLRVGEMVFAVGHPWGVRGGATTGIVIGKGHDLPEMPLNQRDWLAVSLHYRPGHSGGALVDTQGRLLGINTMMAGPDVGLAVPVHIVQDFMQDFLRGQSV